MEEKGIACKRLKILIFYGVKKQMPQKQTIRNQPQQHVKYGDTSKPQSEHISPIEKTLPQPDELTAPPSLASLESRNYKVII